MTSPDLVKTSQVVVIMWKDPVSCSLDAAVEHLDRLPAVVVQHDMILVKKSNQPVVVVQRLNVSSNKLASLALGPRQRYRLQLFLQTSSLSCHHL